MSNDLIKPAIFVGGVAVGVGVGYLLTKNHFQKKADEEVEASRLYYEKHYEQAIDDTQEEMKENVRIGQEVYREHLTNKAYMPSTDEFDDPPRWEEREAAKASAPKIQIIRPEPDPDEPMSSYGYVGPDLESENVLKWPRDPREPYVITFEEYQTENPHWDKHCMTYYEYCNTLADERDAPVDDVDDQVGVNNLLHFGKGSGNPDLLYIRNAFREVDIEISRDTRSFAEAVMGIPNTTHGEKQPSVKRRDDI